MAKFRLTQEAKDKWIEALRSGKYRQGEGALKTRDASRHTRYCCLGVLQKVCDIDSGNEHFLADKCPIFEGGKSAVVGLSRKKQNRLADLNDEGGKNFKEIADWIEKHVKPVKEGWGG